MPDTSHSKPRSSVDPDELPDDLWATTWSDDEAEAVRRAGENPEVRALLVKAVSHINQLQMRLDHALGNNPDAGACACCYDQPDDTCLSHVQKGFTTGWWEADDQPPSPAYVAAVLASANRRIDRARRKHGDEQDLRVVADTDSLLAANRVTEIAECPVVYRPNSANKYKVTILTGQEFENAGFSMTQSTVAEEAHD